MLAKLPQPGQGPGSHEVEAKRKAGLDVVANVKVIARPERRYGKGWRGELCPIPILEDTLQERGASPHRPKGQ